MLMLASTTAISPSHLEISAPSASVAEAISAPTMITLEMALVTAISGVCSAGVTDLRYGNFLDEHWEGRDRFAFGSDPRVSCGLPDVPCFAIAGTTDEIADEDGSSDGLVPIESALGKHESTGCNLGIPKDHQLVVAKTGHLDLLDNLEVYEQIRAWLAAL